MILLSPTGWHWRPHAPDAEEIAYYGRDGGFVEVFEVADDLVAPDGVPVALLMSFPTNPDAFYCSAREASTGNWLRLGAGYDYQTTKAWAEKTAGMRP